MENNEFAKIFSGIYEKICSVANDADYIVDDDRYEDFINAMRFFASNGGKVIDSELVPGKIHGGLTVEFSDLLYLALGELEEFQKIVKTMSAISIEPTLDGTIIISFVIPDIFKKK